MWNSAILIFTIGDYIWLSLKYRKSPLNLTAQGTLVIILPEIDQHCLTLWCSDGIKIRTITSFGLTATWKSFLFDLDYNIRGYSSLISDTGLCSLSTGCVGGCWLNHFMKDKPFNHIMFQSKCCIYTRETTVLFSIIHSVRKFFAELWKYGISLKDTVTPFNNKSNSLCKILQMIKIDH